MNIKEIAPKLTQRLSIAINDDEAVEFAEALIESYKAELLKEAGEPVLYAEFAEDGGWLGDASEYADHLEEPHALFTSDQVAAAVAKATKPLEEEIERLNRKISAYKSRIFTNTNREMVLRNRFFTAHEDAFVCDNNFDFDAGLQVSGDFIGDEKQRYAQMVASTLNDYQALEDQLATAEQRVAEAVGLFCDNYGQKTPKYRHGQVERTVADDISACVRSGEYRKYMKWE